MRCATAAALLCAATSAAGGLLTPPCPMANGATVGGVAGQFIDINADGKVDVVYSFSKGSFEGERTGIATFLGTGTGFCKHFVYPSDFYQAWYQSVGSCISTAVTDYPDCNDTSLIPSGALLATPCALSAYYPQTPNSVRHGEFVDINADGKPDIVYSYVEGAGESAIATFLNNGTTFCALHVQQVFSDQCMPNAQNIFPPCAGARTDAPMAV